MNDYIADDFFMVKSNRVYVKYYIPIKQFLNLFERPIFGQLLGCVSMPKKKAFALSITAAHCSFGMPMASMRTTTAIKEVNI